MSRIKTRRLLHDWKHCRKQRFALERELARLQRQALAVEARIGVKAEVEAQLEARIVADILRDGNLSVGDRVYYVERKPADAGHFFDTLQVRPLGRALEVA